MSADQLQSAAAKGAYFLEELKSVSNLRVADRTTAIIRHVHDQLTLREASGTASIEVANESMPPSDGSSPQQRDSSDAFLIALAGQMVSADANTREAGLALAPLVIEQYLNTPRGSEYSDKQWMRLLKEVVAVLTGAMSTVGTLSLPAQEKSARRLELVALLFVVIDRSDFHPEIRRLAFEAASSSLRAATVGAPDHKALVEGLAERLPEILRLGIWSDLKDLLRSDLPDAFESMTDDERAKLVKSLFLPPTLHGRSHFQELVLKTIEGQFLRLPLASKCDILLPKINGGWARLTPAAQTALIELTDKAIPQAFELALWDAKSCGVPRVVFREFVRQYSSPDIAQDVQDKAHRTVMKGLRIERQWRDLKYRTTSDKDEKDRVQKEFEAYIDTYVAPGSVKLKNERLARELLQFSRDMKREKLGSVPLVYAFSNFFDKYSGSVNQRLIGQRSQYKALNIVADGLIDTLQHCIESMDGAWERLESRAFGVQSGFDDMQEFLCELEQARRMAESQPDFNPGKDKVDQCAQLCRELRHRLDSSMSKVDAKTAQRVTMDLVAPIATAVLRLELKCNEISWRHVLRQPIRSIDQACTLLEAKVTVQSAIGKVGSHADELLASLDRLKQQDFCPASAEDLEACGRDCDALAKRMDQLISGKETNLDHMDTESLVPLQRQLLDARDLCNDLAAMTRRDKREEVVPESAAASVNPVEPISNKPLPALPPVAALSIANALTERVLEQRELASTR